MSKDQTIRDVAYAIWEAEGRPDGQDEAHWQQAELLVEEQVSEEAKPSKIPTAAATESR